MRVWVCMTVAALLCQELSLFRAMAAKKERKKMKEPSNQYTEPFNATLSNSEELHGHAKVDIKLRIPYTYVYLPSNISCYNIFSSLTNFLTHYQEGGIQVTFLMTFHLLFSPEATERRVSPSLPANPSELPPLLSLEEISLYKRVEEAFHCKLKGQVVVDKKTLVELQNFQTPLAKGAFLRGSGLNLVTGRFTAPVSGIYQFSANVHIDHSELKSKLQLRARDNVRVLICIESLCHRYTSLEVIAGLESNSKIFTVYVHGLLQLQAGQYTSIFVDNSAGAPITIQNGSDFMGMLMGV
uniref:Adipolin n=1 Tax=Sphenodon punctatus TaxID=8508 RepID=A0A8D0GA40_SPHPU